MLPGDAVGFEQENWHRAPEGEIVTGIPAAPPPTTTSPVQQGNFKIHSQLLPWVTDPCLCPTDWPEHVSYVLELHKDWGAWVAQSAEGPTLGFCSGHGLAVSGVRAPHRDSLSPFLSLPLPSLGCLCLSQNK